MQETMQVQFTSLLDHLSANRTEAVLATQLRLNELTLITDADHVVELLGFLRDDQQCRFICLLDICGVDWPGRAARFDVVYHLLSPGLNLRLRVKLATDEDTPVPSACGIFACADWYEREAWDL
jgi:NADH-quinone oxidoreductase subunit C